MTNTEAPTTTAPSTVEVGDTFTRMVTIDGDSWTPAGWRFGTYRAQVTLSMAHLGAPYSIWIWRVEITDPAYQGTLRHYRQRFRETFAIPGVPVD